MQQTKKKRAGRPKGSPNKTVRLRTEDFYRIIAALLELDQVPERLSRLEFLLSQQSTDRLSGKSTRSKTNINTATQ